MRDRHIDQAEAERYNNHACEALKALLALSPELPRITADLSGFQPRLSQVKAEAADTRSTVTVVGEDRAELSARTRDRLGRLLDKLKDQKKDGATFDLARMFPTATRKDIGVSIADRKAALSRALTGLIQYQTQIKDSQAWIDELTKLDQAFSEKVTEGTSAGSTKLDSSRQLRQTLEDWKRNYAAAKFIVRGVLKREGRESEWKNYFLDLQLGRGATSPQAPSS